MSRISADRHILLVEPQFVLRRTIVALARDFGVGRLHEASSPDVGLSLLASERFDGMVLDLTHSKATLDLLTRLREGRSGSDADIPVVGLTSDPLGAADDRVRPFGLLRLMGKPFKVGELLQVMQQMSAPRR